MDKLREILSEWARLKALRDKIAEEMKYRDALCLMKQKMKSGDVVGVAETYANIYQRMEKHDDELAMQYVLDGLGRLLVQHNLKQASCVLSAIGGLSSGTFHRAKSLFADYVARVSSEYANQQVTEYMSTVLILRERLDPNDVFKLRAFIDKLCLQRLDAFKKEGWSIAEEVSRDAERNGLLKLDRWIGQCAKLLSLQYDIDTGNLGELYGKIEMLYFESCIKNIILRDQKHGSDDLVFLSKKICARASKTAMHTLKNKIKKRAVEVNILNSVQMQEVAEL